MLAREQEVENLKKIIMQLNYEKKCVIVVEGKKDIAALRKIGLTSKVLEYHRFGGMVKFVDHVAKFERVIILFDYDKKGRYLTRKIIQHLQRRSKVDLSYKRKLSSITRGKIRFIEQLVCYEPYLV